MTQLQIQMAFDLNVIHVVLNPFPSDWLLDDIRSIDRFIPISFQFPVASESSKYLVGHSKMIDEHPTPVVVSA